jgi:8-oxo-dGTP pyrophosphatase MutT (NUDIX family)
VPASLADDFRELLRDRVRAFRRVPVEGSERVAAAVAIVVLSDRFGRPCFVLTRRAATLRRNAGQWALPGGRCDPGEEPCATALRELWEELAVPAAGVEPLGALDDYATESGYVITPVVFAAAPISRLRPNPDEVAAVYRIPLTALGGEDMPIIEARGDLLTLRYRIRGRLINPPTAAILHQFTELVLFGRETRVSHFVQPEFTWT